MRKKYIYLIAGLVLTLIGLIHLFYFDRNDLGRYQKVIQSGLDKEIATVNSEHLKIASQIQLNKQNVFSDYHYPSSNPYFIYQGDSLVYWSDYKFIIKDVYLKASSKPYIIDDNQNVFLVVSASKEYDNNKYSIYSLINLYRHSGSGRNISQPKFNPRVLNYLADELSVDPSGNEFFPVLSSFGENLFWVKPLIKSRNLNKISSPLSKVALGLGIGLVLLFSIQYYRRFLKDEQYIMVGIIFSIIVLLFRFILKVFNIPWMFFSPGQLPSYLVDSGRFGDKIIFMFCGLIILHTLSVRLKYNKPNLSGKFSTGHWRSFISVLLYIGALLVSLRCFYLITKFGGQSLYISPSSLRYYMIIFNFPVYIYLIFLFSVFFLAFHFSVYYFHFLNPNIRSGFIHWIYAAVLGVLLALYFEKDILIAVATSVFFLLSYLFNLPKSYYHLELKTYGYLILGALLYTLILYKATAKIEYAQRQSELEQIAESLKLQRDFRGEILLSQLNNSLRDSPALKKALKQDVLPYENIEYVIKDSLLDIYFENYDVQVFAFDNLGQPIVHSPKTSLADIYEKYINRAEKTECKYLTLSQLYGQENMYTLLNEVRENNILIGTVVVNLVYDFSKLKFDLLNFSGLLNNKMFDLNNYSYGILSPNGKWLLQKGNFEYNQAFVDFILSKSVNEFFDYKQYFNYVSEDDKGNLIVTSTPLYSFKNFISKLSNLYLLSIVGVFVLFLFLILISGVNNYKLTFSSRLRAYTNVAFLIPLTIIILVTSAVVTESLRENQEDALLENSMNIANTINLYYQNYQSGQISKGFLLERLNNNFNNADIEINIYNQEGKMFFSTRPGYYEYNILSGSINPDAIIAFQSANRKNVILREEISNFEFKTVYFDGKLSSGESYGYIGISYPKSEITLERQTKRIITAILVTFFILFVILMFLSFLVSQKLTQPLRLIAQKLNKTGLDGANEKLDWKGGGEIGLLATEYNHMIEKLEKSKQDLYNSQKQTAWKEMAKQVAHEIKNPLTPMKLSIQQLQRTLKVDDIANKDRINRVLSSINEQIDTISEIANSFSDFAKMPAPISEPFELVNLVQKIVNLYAQNSRLMIRFESDIDEIWVLGDKMVLNRAVTNLILNGIQSVGENEHPEILVRVSGKGSKAHVEVIDNGDGITEENKKKIFVPNFTTKAGGSGLGLAMAKRGIEHGGGNIWFESEEGKGSTFFIDLVRIEKPE